MLTIRLQRTGSKNNPSFRIVLAQAYRAADKKVVEVLGNYNPLSKSFAIKDQERLNYWLSQHVALSPTVHNLLVEKKMLTEKKVKAWQPKKKAAASGATAAPEAVVTPAPAAEATPPTPETTA